MAGLALRRQQPGLGAHLHQDFKHCISINKDKLPLKTAQNWTILEIYWLLCSLLNFFPIKKALLSHKTIDILLHVGLWWREMKLFKPFYFFLLRQVVVSVSTGRKKGYRILNDQSCSGISMHKTEENVQQYGILKAFFFLSSPVAAMLDLMVSQIGPILPLLLMVDHFGPRHYTIKSINVVAKGKKWKSNQFPSFYKQRQIGNRGKMLWDWDLRWDFNKKIYGQPRCFLVKEIKMKKMKWILFMWKRIIFTFFEHLLLRRARKRMFKHSVRRRIQIWEACTFLWYVFI